MTPKHKLTLQAAKINCYKKLKLNRKTAAALFIMQILLFAIAIDLQYKRI